MGVTACLVTRGNVDLRPIVDSIPRKWDIVIWDNSKRQDLSVYGRYAAIKEAEGDLIYVQDDDVLLETEVIEEIAWTSDSGTDAYGALVCNMPPHWRPMYPDSALVGFGACFHRNLPAQAFKKFGAVDNDTCDVVFTTLTPRTLVDLPVQILEYAYGSDRMYKQPGFAKERQQAHDLALSKC